MHSRAGTCTNRASTSDPNGTISQAMNVDPASGEYPLAGLKNHVGNRPIRPRCSHCAAAGKWYVSASVDTTGRPAWFQA